VHRRSYRGHRAPGRAGGTTGTAGELAELHQRRPGEGRGPVSFRAPPVISMQAQCFRGIKPPLVLATPRSGNSAKAETGGRFSGPETHIPDGEFPPATRHSRVSFSHARSCASQTHIFTPGLRRPPNRPPVPALQGYGSRGVSANRSLHSVAQGAA